MGLFSTQTRNSAKEGRDLASRCRLRGVFAGLVAQAHGSNDDATPDTFTGRVGEDPWTAGVMTLNVPRRPIG
jgi:hypothetical protein